MPGELLVQSTEAAVATSTLVLGALFSMLGAQPKGRRASSKNSSAGTSDTISEPGLLRDASQSSRRLRYTGGAGTPGGPGPGSSRSSSGSGAGEESRSSPAIQDSSSGSSSPGDRSCVIRHRTHDRLDGVLYGDGDSPAGDDPSGHTGGRPLMPVTRDGYGDLDTADDEAYEQGHSLPIWVGSSRREGGQSCTYKDPGRLRSGYNYNNSGESNEPSRWIGKGQETGYRGTGYSEIGDSGTSYSESSFGKASYSGFTGQGTGRSDDLSYTGCGYDRVGPPGDSADLGYCGFTSLRRVEPGAISGVDTFAGRDSGGNNGAGEGGGGSCGDGGGVGGGGGRSSVWRHGFGGDSSDDGQTDPATWALPWGYGAMVVALATAVVLLARRVQLGTPGHQLHVCHPYHRPDLSPLSPPLRIEGLQEPPLRIEGLQEPPLRPYQALAGAPRGYQDSQQECTDAVLVLAQGEECGQQHVQHEHQQQQGVAESQQEDLQTHQQQQYDKRHVQEQAVRRNEQPPQNEEEEVSGEQPEAGGAGLSAPQSRSVPEGRPTAADPVPCLAEAETAAAAPLRPLRVCCCCRGSGNPGAGPSGRSYSVGMSTASTLAVLSYHGMDTYGNGFPFPGLYDKSEHTSTTLHGMVQQPHHHHQQPHHQLPQLPQLPQTSQLPGSGYWGIFSGFWCGGGDFSSYDIGHPLQPRASHPQSRPRPRLSGPGVQPAASSNGPARGTAEVSSRSCGHEVYCATAAEQAGAPRQPRVTPSVVGVQASTRPAVRAVHATATAAGQPPPTVPTGAAAQTAPISQHASVALKAVAPGAARIESQRPRRVPAASSPSSCAGAAAVSRAGDEATRRSGAGSARPHGGPGSISVLLGDEIATLGAVRKGLEATQRRADLWLAQSRAPAGLAVGAGPAAVSSV